MQSAHAFLRPLGGHGTAMDIVSLARAEHEGLPVERLPRSLRIMAEGLLRKLPGEEAANAVRNLAARTGTVQFSPGRVLLQDFLGIPLMTDMASMRDALATAGQDPAILNPAIPVDFVVDHSLVVYHSGKPEALRLNREEEFTRNRERFAFIKWCERAFDNVRVVPPGSGIMHQVNLEWLSDIVSCERQPNGRLLAVPDTMIGTDSHSTMVNGLGVLGWGVGGIEAESAMLGEPILMQPPRVVGVRLEGSLRPGVTATDLVLHMTEFLRRVGVVDAFVEFLGSGLQRLPVADRATIANMAPEYGATCAYFPVDGRTLDYLRMTGRSTDQIDRVERYTKEQGLWQQSDSTVDLVFDEEQTFDLSAVEPSLAGPTRPQDRVPLADVPASLRDRTRELGRAPLAPLPGSVLEDGSVVLAAITSCTNTANPPLMIAAGLLARKAVERGLAAAPWVKTSLSPGSRAVTAYLQAAGLQPYLDQLGFQTVGYGCATCNGNSGPLPEAIGREIDERDVLAIAVLSGNRNFEGRIHPKVKGAYLASPPLVLSYAIAGTVSRDFTKEPVGWDKEGRGVHLHEIWPSDHEIADALAGALRSSQFRELYDSGNGLSESWASLEAASSPTFSWDPQSTFIRPSPFPFLGQSVNHFRRLSGLRPLLILGDAITTDHISPNGSIPLHGATAVHLSTAGVSGTDYGNYGARRGNAEVCARGMFDNALLRNEAVPDSLGNVAVHLPSGRKCSVFEAGTAYRADGVGTLIVAGKNYGAGSSRDWAAKGLRLLGIEAVLAESFERIHRANLIGSGVLPLVFAEAQTRHSLGLDSEHVLDVELVGDLRPGAQVQILARHPRQQEARFHAFVDIRTPSEASTLAEGGLLPQMLAQYQRHSPPISSPSSVAR
jgi:aconitate hydratase